MIFYLVFIFICCVCGGEALAWRVCTGQRTVGGAYSCLFSCGSPGPVGAQVIRLAEPCFWPSFNFFFFFKKKILEEFSSVVESLPGKHKALGSILTSGEKK